MAEQWALLHIDQLMPHPPVPPKALGCLSLRGTPWVPSLYPQVIHRQKEREHSHSVLHSFLWFLGHHLKEHGPRVQGKGQKKMVWRRKSEDRQYLRTDSSRWRHRGMGFLRVGWNQARRIMRNQGVGAALGSEPTLTIYCLDFLGNGG